MNVQYKRIITFPNDTIIDCVISNANNKKKVIRRLLKYLKLKSIDVDIDNELTQGYYCKINSHHFILFVTSLENIPTILHETMHIFLHICNYLDLTLHPNASEWPCNLYSDLTTKVLKNNYNQTAI